MGAAKAIAAGVEKGHSAENPGYWIHVSGTGKASCGFLISTLIQTKLIHSGILCWKDQETQILGEAPHQPPYNDLEGVADLTGLPDKAWHREIDKAVLAAGSDSVKTAIVCPPTIYGPGRGPGNKKSRQVYVLAEMALKRGQTPILGKGLTEWDNVNIHDLSDLFVLLVEVAIKSKAGETKDIDAELWNERGYFLAENGHQYVIALIIPRTIY